jgi:hypothetical protein
MGYAYMRIGKDGKLRYSAIYHDARGQRRSAGRCSTRKEADKKWQNTEAKIAERRLGDPRRGCVQFKTYVETTRLPNHEMELTTRERYMYSIAKHLMRRRRDRTRRTRPCPRPIFMTHFANSRAHSRSPPATAR